MATFKDMMELAHEMAGIQMEPMDISDLTPEKIKEIQERNKEMMRILKEQDSDDLD